MSCPYLIWVGGISGGCNAVHYRAALFEAVTQSNMIWFSVAKCFVAALQKVCRGKCLNAVSAKNTLSAMNGYVLSGLFTACVNICMVTIRTLVAEVRTRAVESELKISGTSCRYPKFWPQLRHLEVFGSGSRTILSIQNHILLYVLQLAWLTNYRAVLLFSRNRNFWFRLQPFKNAWTPAPQPWLEHNITSKPQLHDSLIIGQQAKFLWLVIVLPALHCSIAKDCDDRYVSSPDLNCSWAELFVCFIMTKQPLWRLLVAM